VGDRRLLRRGVAGEGRAIRCRLPNHVTLRRTADGGARLRQPFIPPHRGRLHHSLDVPAYIYHLGDYDPSGVNAGEKIEETLREMAPGSEIIFERLAVEPEQIEAWNLPTRPTKASDSRAKHFGEVSVELDAIDPDRLRSLVRRAIENHLPEHEYAILKAAEESERETLRMLIGGALNGGRQ
jgi:hypothetical protein